MQRRKHGEGGGFSDKPYHGRVVEIVGVGPEWKKNRMGGSFPAGPQLTITLQPLDVASKTGRRMGFIPVKESASASWWVNLDVIRAGIGEENWNVLWSILEPVDFYRWKDDQGKWQPITEAMGNAGAFLASILTGRVLHMKRIDRYPYYEEDGTPTVRQDGTPIEEKNVDMIDEVMPHGWEPSQPAPQAPVPPQAPPRQSSFDRQAYENAQQRYPGQASMFTPRAPSQPQPAAPSAPAPQYAPAQQYAPPAASSGHAPPAPPSPQPSTGTPPASVPLPTTTGAPSYPANAPPAPEPPQQHNIQYGTAPAAQPPAVQTPQVAQAPPNGAAGHASPGDPFLEAVHRQLADGAKPKAHVYSEVARHVGVGMGEVVQQIRSYIARGILTDEGANVGLPGR
jgi:hypothetical protein